MSDQIDPAPMQSTPPPGGRLLFVTAIVMIVLACLGFICNPFFMMIIIKQGLLDELQGLTRIFTLIYHPLIFFCSALVLTAGIGLLRPRAWAWRLGVCLYGFLVFIKLINGGLAVFLMVQDAAAADSESKAMMIGRIFGGVIGSCIQILIPIAILIILLQPSIRALCRPAAQTLDGAVS